MTTISTVLAFAQGMALYRSNFDGFNSQNKAAPTKTTDSNAAREAAQKLASSPMTVEATACTRPDFHAVYQSRLQYEIPVATLEIPTNLPQLARLFVDSPLYSRAAALPQYAVIDDSVVR